MNRAATMNRNDMYQHADGRDQDFDSGESSLADDVDLQHYLRILRKHKWGITLFTALITGLAGYYAFTATPIYRASSTLLIEEQKANLVSIEELYGIDNENTDYYQTQFELLKSRNLAQKVVERLDLWNHPELSAAARTATAQAAAAEREVIDGTSTGFVGQITDFLVGLGLVDKRETSAAAGVNGTAVSDKGRLNGGSREAPIDASAAGAGGDFVLDLEPDQSSFGSEFAGVLMLDDSGRPVDENGKFIELDSGDFAGGGPALEPRQEYVLANFMRRLLISPIRKTKLVNISFESADPVLAARIANTVAQQYITSYLDAKLEMTTIASTWLNERLGELKVNLEEAKGRLIAFKQDNNLVDVDGSVGRLNEQEILFLNTTLADARSDLANAQDIVRTVDSLAAQPELLETIPAIQLDPLVQQVKIQQGIVQRELDELSNRYGPRHPNVIDKQSELASLTSTLDGHIRRVVGTLRNDARAAQQRVASIQAKVASGRSEIQALGTKKFELDTLAREVETKQGIYDQFYSRMTEARSADGLEIANARISEYARPPVSPVKPKKQMIIALATLASLVLSMLMALLYETMDDTIKSTNDIERKLGIKLLGILPLIKSGLLKTKTDLPLNPLEIPDKKGTFSEAVNTARTALCMDDGDTPRKVIVVTSTVPGEGKSTASINLAYSLGQLERVLLIDCDLRRPTIAKAAGLDRSVSGLTNLITNAAQARDCIKRGVFGGSVDILPSGPIPDQPLELLSSKRFEKILEELSKHYDRIVIDSAPTQAVSDALILSRLADAVVYVIKSHETSIDLVRRGLTRLQQANAPMAGALVTQVDIDKITSYGGDYYYQGYYDYYGYTEKGERLKHPGKIRLTQEELLRIKSDESDVNLDLDYGAADGVGRRRFDIDNGLDFGPEMSVGKARGARGGSAGGGAEPRPGRSNGSTRPRFEDDLDIL